MSILLIFTLCLSVTLSAQRPNLSKKIPNDVEKEQKKIREKFQPNKNMHVSDDASVKKHLLGLLDMEEELVKLKK